MRPVLFTLSLIGLLGCSKPDEVFVHTQVTGILNTNCYLLYSENTREATLIDVGDTIDSLLQIIDEKALTLKYILITHAHPDHMYGVQRIKDQFPKAKICFSREEYEDMLTVYEPWETSFQSMVDQIRSSPAALALFGMDYEAIGEPEVVMQDSLTIRLGKNRIMAISSPGHARGSMCYYLAPYLFSGDELLYRRVGNTRTSPSSSWDSQVKSIRRLYTLLPDTTIVYPGHGQSTTIGIEKKENTVISENHLQPN